MDGDIVSLAALYAKEGTTTFCPTTMSAPHDDIVNVLSAKMPTAKEGAAVGGFHAEGPFINKKKKGAMNEDCIRLPDKKEFEEFDNISLITVAPEVDGAINYIKSSKAAVCVGHTDADYETVCRAADAGAKCVTHLFNTMPPLHHREPSVLGAAYDKGMYVQLITDGIHIHPSVVRIVYKLFGSERMIIISDSMRATRLSDGEYDLGGQQMTVKDSIARTKDGALAGSTATLFDCVKKAISFGIDADDAFKMASETPAKLLGLNCGKIEVGYDCDLIVLEDNELRDVIIKGELYKAQEEK
jgi:N-acetylglucosamine-6-phosphate deacetylase